MNALMDFELEEAERLVNSSIHELVFVLHHLKDDQVSDGVDCLQAVALNIGRLGEITMQVHEPVAR